MNTRHAAGALLVLAALAGSARAGDPAAGQPAEKPMGCCQQMMQNQKENAATLESKTAAMNAAQGTEKVDAIAAVVNELVVQHRAMHGDRGCPGGCPMGEMHENMGGTMASTMEHGTMPHDAPGPPNGDTRP
jgi:hypothetical protein